MKTNTTVQIRNEHDYAALSLGQRADIREIDRDLGNYDALQAAIDAQHYEGIVTIDARGFVVSLT